MAVSTPLMPGRSATLGRMFSLPARQFLASQTTRRRFAPCAAERAEAKAERDFPCALWGFWGAACLKGTELGFQFSNTRFCGLSQSSFPTGTLLSLQAGLFGLDTVLLSLDAALLGLQAGPLALLKAPFILPAGPPRRSRRRHVLCPPPPVH